MATQITLRIPLQQYGYLEVSGDDAEEVSQACAAALEAQLHEQGIEIEKIARLASGLGGATVVAQPEVGQPAVHPVPVVSQAEQQLAAPPVVQGEHSCVHGARVFKSGTSKAGKPYSLWACVSMDRANQCKPEWA